MFENLNLTHIITIGVIILLFVSVVITIIIAMSKKSKNESVLDKPSEIKDISFTVTDPKIDVETIEPKKEIKKEEIKPIVKETPVVSPVVKPKPTLSELEQKMAGKPINKEENNNAAASALRAMQKDLVQKKQDTVEVFEQEQEEKAVISYQELLQRKKAIAQTKVAPRPVTNSNVQSSKPVQPRPVPVQPENVYDEHELERTLNIAPISQEIKRNDEFLKALKDFRKNL